MTGEMTKIASGDGGEFGVYLSKPSSGSGPGVVMIQEIFGITPWLKEIADEFAGQEYVVIVPDFFWRLEPGFVADPANESDLAKGFQYRSELDHRKAVEDVDSCLGALKAIPECNGKVTVVGFCLGGTFAYLASIRLQIDAAVSYYGTQIHEYLEEAAMVSCPLLLHMAEQENNYTMEDTGRIQKALGDGPNVTLHMYDAGHAFANSSRADKFNKAAAEKAHERTFNFLQRLK
jgi:carboxymethylenebutenolidase